MRISDWSSDVCSSDLPRGHTLCHNPVGRLGDRGICDHRGRRSDRPGPAIAPPWGEIGTGSGASVNPRGPGSRLPRSWLALLAATGLASSLAGGAAVAWLRTEEHTSELQSLMRISYAVFCLTQK